MQGVLSSFCHPQKLFIKSWHPGRFEASKQRFLQSSWRRQKRNWNGVSVVFEMENPSAIVNSGGQDLTAKFDEISVGSNGTAASAAGWCSDSSLIEVDTVSEAELKENGFRSTRRTKLVCTIGPASCEFDKLEALAIGGMNVARINMCHGTRDWHRNVIRNVRKLNEEKGYAVAIMMDTEGSEIHMGDLGGAASVKAEVLFLS